MGEGAFGSNGSVHWKIVHTIDEQQQKGAFVRGRDPNVPWGRNEESLLPEYFEVTLRFNDPRELEAALGNRQITGGTTLVLRVPRRNPAPPIPPTTNWEVSVAW